MKQTRSPFCFFALILAVFSLCTEQQAPAAVPQEKDAAAALLVSAPWKMSCEYWFKICTFAKDGTFTIGGEDALSGTWEIANNVVTLGYKDGHKETLTLPVDPKGTGGFDKDGNLVSAVMEKPAPAVPPSVNLLTTTSLLVSGTWRVKGSWWRSLRIFKKDGTFSGGESGTWKIANNTIVLTFPDGHNDTFALPLDPKGTDGTDSNGKPTCATLVDPAVEKLEDENNKASRAARNAQNATAGAAFGTNQPGASATSAPEAAPLSPEMQQKAADFVKAYHNDLVFVTNKEGDAGSGFIAALGSANFLFTNAHVAAGVSGAAFRTLDDTPVKGGAASVAVGRDVFCMAMPAGGTPLQIMQDVEGNAAIGDEVVVLGNAEGQGVINTITGKIVGIGPDRIEIDAPIVHGNSGSPIIHLKSGKVIGVATYLWINNYDTTTNEKMAKPVVRRFGYRIDNVKSWQAVDWRSFSAQAAEMGKIETLTADLYDLFVDMHENKGSITPGRHTNPVIKNHLDQWLEDRTTTRSAADEDDANAGFFSYLKLACQSDVAAARRDMTYDYFQRELADEQRSRDEMSKAFEQIINNLRK